MEALLTVLLAGAIWWLVRRRRRRATEILRPQKSPHERPASSSSRVKQGGSVQEVWDWSSRELDRMVASLCVTTDLVDRHFLLLQICAETYRKRSCAEARAAFLRFAETQIEECPHALPAVVRRIGGVVPHVPTYERLATVLAESKEYARAIEVCERAIALGLCDRTKSGYPGRIERIRARLSREQGNGNRG